MKNIAENQSVRKNDINGDNLIYGELLKKAYK